MKKRLPMGKTKTTKQLRIINKVKLADGTIYDLLDNYTIDLSNRSQVSMDLDVKLFKIII